MRKAKNPLGYVLWEGKSRLDQSPIVVIVTLSSINRKTGDMAQTWILHQDVRPAEAVRTGADRSICGDCAHRPFLAKLTGDIPCYVTVGYAPTAVWKSYREGKYPFDPDAARHELRYKPVRLGSYGDPAAAPPHVWGDLLRKHRAGHTGYTQQWREFPELCHLLMASVHSSEEAQEARDLGWRTFRILQSQGELEAREFICPASPEGGDRLQCRSCLACNGAGQNHNRASVAIVEHGAINKVRSALKLRAQLGQPSGEVEKASTADCQ